MIPGIQASRGGLGGGALGELTLVASPAVNTGGAPYTFSGVSIGPASADRRIVVGVVADGAGNVTTMSCTIDGNSMTRREFKDRGNGNGESLCAIFTEVVTAGTTATFVVDFDGTGGRHCKIFVYTLNQNSVPLATGTADAASGNATLTINSWSASVTFPENSLALFLRYGMPSGGGSQTTYASAWHGRTNKNANSSTFSMQSAFAAPTVTWTPTGFTGALDETSALESIPCDGGECAVGAVW